MIMKSFGQVDRETLLPERQINNACAESDKRLTGISIIGFGQAADVHLAAGMQPPIGFSAFRPSNAWGILTRERARMEAKSRPAELLPHLL